MDNSILYRAMRRFAAGLLSIALIGFLATAAYAQEDEPEEEPVTEEAAPVVEETPAPPDVVAVLQEHGGFTRLIEALEQTGLADELASSQSFTLFAPTDEAFAALGEDVSNEELAAILEYHIVPKAYASQELTGATEVPSRSGKALAIGGQGTTVGEANIVEADIRAGGGVIHAIDMVLMKPDQEQ